MTATVPVYIVFPEFKEQDGFIYPRIRLIWSQPLGALIWEVQDRSGVEVKYIRAFGAEEPKDRVFNGVAGPGA